MANWPEKGLTCESSKIPGVYCAALKGQLPWIPGHGLGAQNLQAPLCRWPVPPLRLPKSSGPSGRDPVSCSVSFIPRLVALVSGHSASGAGRGMGTHSVVCCTECSALCPSHAYMCMCIYNSRSAGTIFNKTI